MQQYFPVCPFHWPDSIWTSWTLDRFGFKTPLSENRTIAVLLMPMMRSTVFASFTFNVYVTTTLLAVVNLTIEEHIVGVGDVGHWWQKYFIYTHSQCTAGSFNNFCIHIYAYLHLMTWSHLYNTMDPLVFVSILVFVFDKLISFVLPNGPLIQTDCPCLAQPTILNRTLPKSLLFFFSFLK